MPYCNKRYILTSMQQMDRDFSIEKMFHTDWGFAGDYVCTNLKGEQVVIPKEDIDDYIKIDIPIDKEAMAKGYQEMGELNKALAEEHIHTYNDGEFK